jgi:hypothetical protein
LHSTGDSTPPCGVPLTGRRTAPSSSTPARKNAPRSPRTRRSQIRSVTADINPECGSAEKQSAMSVSTTHRRPCQAGLMTTCKASWAARRGRNPNEQSSMSASKIGLTEGGAQACPPATPPPRRPPCPGAGADARGPGLEAAGRSGQPGPVRHPRAALYRHRLAAAASLIGRTAAPDPAVLNTQNAPKPSET